MTTSITRTTPPNSANPIDTNQKSKIPEQLSIWNKAYQAVTSSRLLQGAVLLTAATLTGILAATLAGLLLSNPVGWLVVAMATASLVLASFACSQDAVK